MTIIKPHVFKRKGQVKTTGTHEMKIIMKINVHYRVVDDDDDDGVGRS